MKTTAQITVSGNQTSVVKAPELYPMLSRIEAVFVKASKGIKISKMDKVEALRKILELINMAYARSTVRFEPLLNHF